MIMILIYNYRHICIKENNTCSIGSNEHEQLHGNNIDGGHPPMFQYSAYHYVEKHRKRVGNNEWSVRDIQ